MTGRRTTDEPRRTALPRVRYWFDTVVARGTPVLIGWLTLVCLAVVVPASVALVWADRRAPTTRSERLVAVWVSVGQTLKIGGAVGSPLYVLFSVLLALVALLFVSTLVSLITTGLNDKVLALRRGRSTVLEERHTVLLGWSEQVFPIVSELVVANSNQRRAVVAVLGPKDKAEMEDEIALAVGRLGRTRLICRSGVTTDPALVALVRPETARAVLVLTHAGEDGDAHVVKTLLALEAAVRGRGLPGVVAAVRDGRHHRAAQLAAGPRGRVLNIEDVTARLIARTSRQPGLSLVHQELLDFEGDEFYTVHEPELTGYAFGRLLLAYATSCVVGILGSAGDVELNPAADRVLGADDRIVLVTEDDDTAVLADGPLPVDEEAIAVPGPCAPPAERFLVLGWNHRAPRIIEQLDPCVPEGSELVIMTNGEEALRDAARCARSRAGRMRITVHDGDITDPRALADLDVASFDRAVVLGYDDADGGAPGALTGDDRTLVTLLHLRALEKASGRELAVVIEMADDRNRLLAPAREGGDFIVGGRLISLLMTQIAENPHLAEVFDRLFSADGDSLHLKPATHYVLPGREVTFATVVESGRRQGHCVLGYRLHEKALHSPSYGVRVNPDKRDRVRFGAQDSVIVLAREPAAPAAPCATPLSEALPGPFPGGRSRDDIKATGGP
ncbi:MULTISPECIES: CASTOR/POLLUX-related putative ion channel [unclassified Streptomyces]|uniref:CASTOR/POLLUX-related putative ion channel n=1 Tax=unclassified Streptomyces TaxID=2593676 RepID=UPI0030E4FD48